METLMYKMSFMSISRGVKCQSKAATSGAIVSSATIMGNDIMPGSLKFEHQDINGNWSDDPGAMAAYQKRRATVQAKIPDYALSADLSAASALFSILGKQAAKKRLTDEQKREVREMVAKLTSVLGSDPEDVDVQKSLDKDFSPEQKKAADEKNHHTAATKK